MCSDPSKCIDHCSVGDSSSIQRLKLLQDISSKSGLFPSSYWILNVKKGKRISCGGEANIYVGCHCDRAVVVRQFLTEGAPHNLDEVCHLAPHTPTHNQAVVLDHNSRGSFSPATPSPKHCCINRDISIRRGHISIRNCAVCATLVCYRVPRAASRIRIFCKNSARLSRLLVLH